MPSHTFGIFMVSRDQGFAANPAGSEGNLCLDGMIGGFRTQIQNSGPLGVFSLAVDLTAIPQPNGPVPVAAGDTWNFTTWFRDASPTGNATSNFSNGVEVTFQ